ncbi:hypothetical protein DFS33DRAFT_1384575 [Desarmillaria ectypa]|nr:hypothetical protein DFS33DRAFT_1384575 [Desarmillaria ectypa]
MAEEGWHSTTKLSLVGGGGARPTDIVRRNGSKVALRITRADTNELYGQIYLCAAERINDTRNHTVPILDIIPIPDEENSVFMVMPLLLDFEHPEFHCRSEFIDAFRSLLEGSIYTVSTYRTGMSGDSFPPVLTALYSDACTLNFLMEASKSPPSPPVSCRVG